MIDDASMMLATDRILLSLHVRRTPSLTQVIAEMVIRLENYCRL